MIKKTITLSCALALTLLFYHAAKGQNAPEPNAIEVNHIQPATYVLEDIQVTGTTYLDPEVVLAISSLRIGDTIQIPGIELNKAIKQLWQQKIVKDIACYASKIADNRLRLYLHVTESERLSTCIFEGVEESEQKKLAEKLDLTPGKIITNRLLKNTQYIAKKYYIKQGYKDVAVEVTTLPDPHDPAYNQIKLIITKGNKLIINKILINGNPNISSDVLRAQLEHINEKPRFTLVKDILYKTITLQPFTKAGIFWHKPNWEQAITYWKTHCIFSASKFRAERYEEDKKRIITYYQDQGYKDAKIVSDRVYKAGKGLLNIEITIDEGPLYYIRSIKWVGNYLHSARTLHKVLNLRRHSIYSPALLREHLFLNPEGLDVSGLYMNDGYLFFQVEPVEVCVEGNQVDLEMRIQEGPQATINQVNIYGNIYSHDYTIRRELRTLPGEKFSKEKLMRSQRELAMLNIFDPNKIQITPLPNLSDSTVDLAYKVVESPKFDIKAGLSLVGGKQLGMTVDLGANNFSFGNLIRGKIPIGDVQAVHIKAEIFSLDHHIFSLQFTEPWLMGKPTMLNVGLSRSFQYYGPGSSLSNVSIRSSLGKRLKWPDNYFSTQGGLKYQVFNYKNYDVFSDQVEMSGKTYELALELGLERNSIDQPLYPKTGSIVSLQSKMTPPYSLFSSKDPKTLSLQEQFSKKEYIQMTLDMDYFYNPLGDWVVNLFARGGALGSYTKQIGPFCRFVMGGTNMPDFSLLDKDSVGLRGYSEGSIAPLDSKTNYRGGVVFDKAGVEVRHPIVKASSFFIYTLLFAEAGNTWSHYSDWKPLQLKRSIGLGLRFQLPIGLVGLDWGYGFDKRMSDKLEAHFILGMSTR